MYICPLNKLKMNKKVFSHIAILGANLIYGVNYNIAKPIMPDYALPLGLVFFRVAGALSLFWLLGYFVKEKVEKKDIFRLAICGVFGVAFNQLLFISGLNFTTPIDASIIMVSNPIQVLIAASILIKERITVSKIVGIAMGATGAVLIITQGGAFSLSGNHFLGNLMIFLNTSSYAVYLVLVKPLMTKYHPLTVIKWVFLFGAFVVLPVGFKQATAIQWTTIPASILWSIVFVVLATTVLAYLLNIFAMKHVSPTTVSIYIYSQPLIASMVSMAIGQDSLTPLKITAGMLIFIGVYFVSVFKPKRIS
jgi:drug/metabolite transporter (DMT)-like permease